MNSQPNFVRITVDDLAKLVRNLALVNGDQEDKRLWTAGQPQTNTPGLSNVLTISPANAYRRAIVLSAFGGEIDIGFGAYPSATRRGIVLNPATQPTLLTLGDIGAAICLDILAFGVAAGSVVLWQEFFGAVALR